MYSLLRSGGNSGNQLFLFLWMKKDKCDICGMILWYICSSSNLHDDVAVSYAAVVSNVLCSHLWSQFVEPILEYSSIELPVTERAVGHDPH